MSQLSPTSSNSQHKQDRRTKHKNYQTIDRAGGKDTYDALRKNLRGSIACKDTYKVARVVSRNISRARGRAQRLLKYSLLTRILWGRKCMLISHGWPRGEEGKVYFPN